MYSVAMHYKRFAQKILRGSPAENNRRCAAKKPLIRAPTSKSAPGVPVGNLCSEVLVVKSAQNWHRQLRPLLEARTRAKIKPAISFHVLRHAHGSTLAMRGVPMGVIAEQLGHADTR